MADFAGQEVKTLNPLVITIHIIACVVLVVLVLLQSGKEGMGVIFGGGSTSLFGSSGAGGLLTKLTGAAAAVFLSPPDFYLYEHHAASGTQGVHRLGCSHFFFGTAFSTCYSGI